MTGHCRRKLGPLGRVLLSVVAALAGVLLAAGPALAASPPVPTFSCAAANGDGSFTYFFGYSFDGASAVTVPIGPSNEFTTNKKIVGQPTEFLPGAHPESFSVTTTDTSLAWHLSQSQVKASSATLCTNVPVVAEAPAALVMPLAAAAPFAVWFITMRRRSRRTAL